MKCEKCGNEFPSKYYFKSEKLCRACYDIVHPEDKVYQKILKKTATSNKPIKLAGILEGIITFVGVFLTIAMVILFIGFVAMMINPEKLDLYSFKDFGILYKLSLVHAEQYLPTYDIDPIMNISNINITFLADIKFNSNDRGFISFYFIMHFIFGGLTIYLLWLLKKILQTVNDKNPFQLENSKRIRTIGFIIIFSQLFAIISGILLTIYFKNPVYLPGFEISLYSDVILVFIQQSVGEIFTGLIILVLAEIFRMGTTYREEFELTV